MSAPSGLRGALAWIIQLLKVRLVDIRDWQRYVVRFKIQKLAYLLKYLSVPGLEGVAFNLYVNGPYSPDLARAYYELAAEGLTEEELRSLAAGFEETALGARPEVKHVAEVFARKPLWWMEIASTAMLLARRYGGLNEEALYRLVRSAKPWVTREEFGSVHACLKRLGLL